MKYNPQYIDIEIDSLTNSIINVITGDNFQTIVSVLENRDLKFITKKNGWLFNWRSELKRPDRDVYKLTIAGNPDIIQGLISNVSFTSKSQLLEHYQKTLGAIGIGANVMVINTLAALKLIVWFN